VAVLSVEHCSEDTASRASPGGSRAQRSRVDPNHIGCQLRTGRENHRSLDHILQFAHIPRPGVRAQLVERGRRDIDDRLPELSREDADEVTGQRLDVLGPFT
jgi:hypothetical protein